MAGGWAKLYKRLIDEAKANSIPISGFFELTPRCNLHCRMCYICSQPDDKSVTERELSAAQWIALGKEARDNGLLFLTLTGGEIFLRKDFWDIYDAYCEMGFNLTLYTNASLLDREKIRRLGAKPPSKLSITIYGASPETYGLVTGHPEAYDSTIRAIRMLIDEGIKPELKTTVIKANYDDFDKLVEYTDSLGIAIKTVNYISPRREGIGTEPEDIRLSPGNVVALEKKIQEYNRKADPNRVDELTARIDEDIMANGELEEASSSSSDEATQQSAFRCLTGKCAFWLSWDGKLLPCGIFSEAYTEPLKIGFDKAWQQIRGVCASVPECKDCIKCSYRSRCMTCPARLMSETGSFEKPAKYLCEMAKERVINNVSY